MGTVVTMKDRVWDDVLDLITDPKDGVPIDVPYEHTYACLAPFEDIASLHERIVWSAQRHIGGNLALVGEMLDYFFGRRSK